MHGNRGSIVSTCTSVIYVRFSWIRVGGDDSAVGARDEGVGWCRERGAEFGVRSITSVANEVRQILWPDGDDAISAIDAIHGECSK